MRRSNAPSMGQGTRHVGQHAPIIIQQIGGTHLDQEHPEKDWAIALPFIVMPIIALIQAVVS